MDAPDAVTQPLVECAVCCKTFVPADVASDRAVCSHCGAHNLNPGPGGAAASSHAGVWGFGGTLSFEWLCGARTPGYVVVRH